MKNIIIAIMVLSAAYLFYNKLFAGPDPSSCEAILFTINNCPPCKDAAKLLKRHKVIFIEYNVNKSEENMQMYKEYGSGHFPLTIIGEIRVEGFDETMLNIAINSLFICENPKLVEMYSKPGCTWCDRTRNFLTNNRIEFVEYNIQSSSSNKNRFDELGGQGTPLVLIGDNKIHGFNKKALKMALKQSDLM
jgi:glutaredoxin